MEQYRPNMGEVPAEDARRDAIHIAVVPLIAKYDMYAGDTFGLDKEGRAVNTDDHLEREDEIVYDNVGIVDPFRGDVWIRAGTRFWAMLWPNTITNLRHVWEHPAFKIKMPERKVKG